MDIQKWEYKDVRPIVDEDKGVVMVGFCDGEFLLKKQIPFYSFINYLGERGWELITNWVGNQYIFRRPIEEDKLWQIL